MLYTTLDISGATLQEYKVSEYKSKVFGFCEIQACEFGVVFSSGFVIRFSGLYLIVKIAEVVGFFVVAMYLGGPFLTSFVPVDAFVF